MPAYNTANTLKKTISDIPEKTVDEIILVDDCSTDNTVAIAKGLGLTVVQHRRKMGYGAVQKRGYVEALKHNADIVILLHSDYQYDPRLILKFIEPIVQRQAVVVTGTRMFKFNALKAGMPWWKYIANRFLNSFANLVLKSNLSDFHNGYRTYSKNFLSQIPFLKFSDKFDFDTDILIQAIINNYKIAEIPHRARYLKENSQMSFKEGCIYGTSILRTLFKFKLHQWGIRKNNIWR